MPDETQQLLKRAVVAYSNARDLLWQIIVVACEEEPEFGRTLWALSHFSSERAQSIILLCQDGRLWDAEILMRPFAEASLKNLFVALGRQPQTRAQRASEYWSELSEVNQLRQALRAEELLREHGSDPLVARTISPLLQIPPGIEALRDKWPKEKRRRLETKWSFGNILETIVSERGEQGHWLGLRGMMHYYNLASHLLHADETGVDLYADRASRGNDERKMLELAHLARVLSDLITLPLLVAFAASDALDLDCDEVANAWHGVEELLFDLRSLGDAFIDSLDGA